MAGGSQAEADQDGQHEDTKRTKTDQASAGDANLADTRSLFCIHKRTQTQKKQPDARREVVRGTQGRAWLLAQDMQDDVAREETGHARADAGLQPCSGSLATGYNSIKPAHILTSGFSI